jgi:hypothetical protein
MSDDSTVNVTVLYDSASGQWSAQNPIKVSPGVTTISWKIGLTSASVGTIAFGTTSDFPGIEFADGWPGSAPQGDAQVWSATIDDTLGADDPPVEYEYTVNAYYQGANQQLPPQPLSWDPEVEEDPGN